MKLTGGEDWHARWICPMRHFILWWKRSYNRHLKISSPQGSSMMAPPQASPQIARIMRHTLGPPGADSTQVGPMLAPWTLLSGSLPTVTSVIGLPSTDLASPIYRMSDKTISKPMMTQFSDEYMWYKGEWVNSLWPSDAIWRKRSGSTLAQVMDCCLTAPSHYLNQCWLIISKV